MPVNFFAEQEPDGGGGIASVGTVLLANKECPWKCLMCDLWKHTLRKSVQPGDIPFQIEYALERLPKVEFIKLYNAGSFFDPAAIPLEDYPAILELLRPFKRVVVECHPRLITGDVIRFAESLRGELEVAIGLETVNPAAFNALNKRSGVQEVWRGLDFLAEEGIRTRAFLLVHPPFIATSAQRYWLEKSLYSAMEFGASVVSMIPTRASNGAMEVLVNEGYFQEPNLAELEHGLKYALQNCDAICLADTWDLKRFSKCDVCFQKRQNRLERMNLQQKVLRRISCSCEGA